MKKQQQAAITDKKFKQLQFEIKKKQKLAEENFMEEEYVDVHRNITKGSDLSKDLEQKGMITDVMGPDMKMFLIEGKSQLRFEVYYHNFIIIKFEISQEKTRKVCSEFSENGISTRCESNR